jgi:hypothetical protein
VRGEVRSTFIALIAGRFDKLSAEKCHRNGERRKTSVQCPVAIKKSLKRRTGSDHLRRLSPYVRSQTHRFL